MKKILSFSFLLLITLLLLTSCPQASGGGGGSYPEPDISPLFDQSEAPTQTNVISMSDLSDGDWEFKEVYWSINSTPRQSTLYAFSNGTSAEVKFYRTTWKRVTSQTYRISGGNKSCVSGSSSELYAMDAANKNILNTFCINHGVTVNWNGTTAILPDDDDKSDFWFEDMLDESDGSYYTAYKNAAGTRFMVKYNSNSGTYNRTYYLKKK